MENPLIDIKKYKEKKNWRESHWKNIIWKKNNMNIERQ